MICPFCGAKKTKKKGTRGNKQRHQCKVCHRRFSTWRQDYGANVLIFDIETSPMKVFSWGLGKKFLTHDQIIQDWFIISWSAKWLFDNKVAHGCLTPDEARRCDDKRIIKELWNFLDDADIIIAHNAKKFDIKRSNTRFILNGMIPPSPYEVIDTLTVARSTFSFSSNRLDYLGELVRNKGKIETNFDLWKECLKGNQVALDHMVGYNIEDVELLEEVYLFLRPWIKSHHNLGLYVESEDSLCPTCGSDKLQWGGFYTTKVGRYSTARCPGCGAICRHRITALSRDKRKELVTSIAR